MNSLTSAIASSILDAIDVNEAFSAAEHVTEDAAAILSAFALTNVEAGFSSNIVVISPAKVITSLQEEACL